MTRISEITDVLAQALLRMNTKTDENPLDNIPNPSVYRPKLEKGEGDGYQNGSGNTGSD